MPVRDATGDDAAGCAAIYAQYVADTTVTSEYESPSVAEVARRIAAARRTQAWVVLEEGRRVVG